MASIGILSVSDGRPGVHAGIARFVADSEDTIVGALEAAGHTVTRGSRAICTNAQAVSEARRLAAASPDLTIVNIPVWAFPHFTVLVASETPGHLLLLSTLDPAYPGMVGMLAAGGALDQVGRRHARAWGDARDPAVTAAVGRHAAAAGALRTLRGSTFGRIGGRPMGMYTAVANPDQWMAMFGIDVEEIDQWELVRRAERVDDGRARAGREWLEHHAAGVHYDGDRLTPELLERQIRCYHALRELVDDWHLDFLGVKAQPELTDNFCTMDVAEAFLNDPYDWEGPKDPIVCSTEADMDGALTMQILRSLSGTPVLFADVRHYHEDLDVWDLCNSGEHATWFAARSDEAVENLARVHLYPEEFYFPAGGAAVHHLAAPGTFTFARLTRRGGRYRLQTMLGELVQFEDDENERLMRASTYVWPHAFAKLAAGPDEILGRYGANHIHAVPGDYAAELRTVCDLAGIEFDPLGDTA